MKLLRLRNIFLVLLFSGICWGIIAGGYHLFEKWRFSRDYQLARQGDPVAQSIGTKKALN